MKTLVFTVVAIGLAATAQAQTAPSQMQVQPAQAQATVPEGPSGNFRDECGFLYNSRGDRIDARGRILPPPRSVGPPCRGRVR
jgi:hypothetical protein